MRIYGIHKAQKAMQAIKVIRADAKARRNAGQSPEVVTLTCAGGCGTTHRVSTAKIRKGQLFLCNAKKTRALCSISIPQVMDGRARQEHHQAAGPFTGVTYVKAGAGTMAMLTVFDACIGQPLAHFGRWLIARQNRQQRMNKAGA